MPVAPGFGRYFIPLNRGKRSVVARPQDRGRARDELRGSWRAADIVLHNFPPRACSARSGSPGRTSTRVSPALVVGRRELLRARTGRSPDVPAVRPRRPGARGPAHRARVTAATTCRCARAGSRWPTSRRASCSRPASSRRSFASRTTGQGQTRRGVAARAPRWPSSSRISSGSTSEADGSAPRTGDRADLDARAAEIAGGLAMNPYYRCYEAADGFLAVACLNLAQRRGLPRALRPGRSRRSTRPTSSRTIPATPRRQASSSRLRSTGAFADALRSPSGSRGSEPVGVPCGPGAISARRSRRDAQVVAPTASIGIAVSQPGLGPVIDLLGAASCGSTATIRARGAAAPAARRRHGIAVLAELGVRFAGRRRAGALRRVRTRAAIGGWRGAVSSPRSASWQDDRDDALARACSPPWAGSELWADPSAARRRRSPEESSSAAQWRPLCLVDEATLGAPLCVEGRARHARGAQSLAGSAARGWARPRPAVVRSPTPSPRSTAAGTVRVDVRR